MKKGGGGVVRVPRGGRGPLRLVGRGGGGGKGRGGEGGRGGGCGGGGGGCGGGGGVVVGGGGGGGGVGGGGVKERGVVSQVCLVCTIAGLKVVVSADRHIHMPHTVVLMHGR